MALWRINISDIRKADKMVHAFVRQWMALSNDISIGYFHAPVSEGGLGIPALRWLAPLHRKDRLFGLVPGRRMENITEFLIDARRVIIYLRSRPSCHLLTRRAELALSYAPSRFVTFLRAEPSWHCLRRRAELAPSSSQATKYSSGFSCQCSRIFQKQFDRIIEAIEVQNQQKVCQ